MRATPPQGARPRERRLPVRSLPARLAIGGLAVASAVAVAVGLWAWLGTPEVDLEQGLRQRYAATHVRDMNGELLRQLPGRLASRGQPVALADISGRMVTATVYAEDQGFWRHPGVDVRAVARAAFGNATARRVVSGASTLTMQLARMARPRRRTWRAKIAELVTALRFERRYTKARLLQLYLNHAPYGGLVRGVEQASRTWLGKSARRLSWAEAAWLAVIPRSPTRLNPGRHPRAALAAQRRLLRRLHRAGEIDADTLAVALAQPVRVRAAASPFDAPHLTRWLAGAARQPQTLHTTLSAPLQRDVASLARVHARRARKHGVAHVAVVVLDTATGAVRAMVGSNAWDGSAGQVNGALALRQPGSTLKPFVYAAAFGRGRSPADVSYDIERHFVTEHGDWRPDNYGRRFHGPVRDRIALASSLNIPAVTTLERVGPASVQDLLTRLGFRRLRERPEHYGLGLALGDAEVTLLELAGAYRALVAGGRARRPYALRSVRVGAGSDVPVPRPPERAVLRPAVAWLVADVLRDARARRLGFGAGGPLDGPWNAACKTGTSKGYRDNWTVCATSEHVVAVWAGDFTGRPLRDGASGVTGAAPLAHDVLARLYGARVPSVASHPPELVRSEVCALSGARPGPHCPHRASDWTWRDQPPRAACAWHRSAGAPPTLPDELAGWSPDVQGGDGLRNGARRTGPRVMKPRPGAVYRVDAGSPVDDQGIPVVVYGPRHRRFELWVDGVRVQTVRGGEPWPLPPTPGDHVLRVVEVGGPPGAATTLSFSVEGATQADASERTRTAG